MRRVRLSTVVVVGVSMYDGASWSFVVGTSFVDAFGANLPQAHRSRSLIRKGMFYVKLREQESLLFKSTPQVESRALSSHRDAPEGVEWDARIVIASPPWLAGWADRLPVVHPLSASIYFLSSFLSLFLSQLSSFSILSNPVASINMADPSQVSPNPPHSQRAAHASWEAITRVELCTLQSATARLS